MIKPNDFEDSLRESLRRSNGRADQLCWGGSGPWFEYLDGIGNSIARARCVMLQLVYRFPHHIRHGDSFYRIGAYGELREDERYAGRLLFFPLGVEGRVLSTGVETTQSDLPALEYWASGLSGTYLEGALARAIARQPEIRLEQLLAQLERAEAEAASEAIELESAADAARREVKSIQQARREVNKQLI